LIYVAGKLNSSNW